MYFFWGSNLFRVYNQKSKTFNNRTCLGEPPGGFCDVSCHFIFVSSFCCCSSFVNVLHSHFLFGIIPHPSVDYRRGFYTPFYTFSPAHCRVIHDTFIFNHSVIFLPRALRFWVGIFYPQAFFTLSSFPTFWNNLLLSRLPWEPSVISRNLQGFILIFKTQTRPICLFDSQ